jgi:hypothetical protein
MNVAELWMHYPVELAAGSPNNDALGRGNVYRGESDIDALGNI